eukprot:406946-Prorocentrum_minimum.AAC.1
MIGRLMIGGWGGGWCANQSVRRNGAGGSGVGPARTVHSLGCEFADAGCEFADTGCEFADAGCEFADA